MRKLFISISAVALALVAPAEVKAEAPVTCAVETTQVLNGIQRNAKVPNPGPAYVGTAISSAPDFLDGLVKNVNEEMSAECQPHTRQNILAYTGKGSWSEPAPKPVVTPPALQSAPAASAMEGKPAVAVAAKPAVASKPATLRVETRTVVVRQVVNPALLAKQRKLENEQKTLTADIKALKEKKGPLTAEELVELKALIDKKEGVDAQLKRVNDSIDDLEGENFRQWIAMLAILIGMVGIVLWVKKTRRSNTAADAKFATKTEVVTIEVHGPVFERLQKLDDSKEDLLEFSTNDGRAFQWVFGRKDGKWFTPTGGIDHNPQHDLIADPAKTIQKWVRKGQITI